MGFVSRSLLVLMALYSLVFLFFNAALTHGALPVWFMVPFVVLLIGVQYVVSPWLIEWLYDIGWHEEDIPAEHVEFIRNLCAQRGLPMPKLGLIESGTPNAFAFGRLRSDARVVMTRGLLNVLTPDEVNAVLAHEIGHIAHYDFAVMALAAIAPLLLWQIYVWTDRLNNQGRIVSYGAYVAYWIGQFLMLLLNRTREYGADHFSAEVTREPNALSSALVKIAYGMVRERSELQRLMKEGSGDEKKSARRTLQAGQALGLMGIASASGWDAMALGLNSPEDAARVMRWDLSNPWSRVYELSSTHPLTAMRLRALNSEALKQGTTPEFPLPEDVKMHWGGFPVELFFWAVPLVCGFLIVTQLWIGRALLHAGVRVPLNFDAWLLTVLGITWGAKIAFRYRGKFTPRKIGSLLEEMSVSQMRPIAIELEGEVIGNGIPGAYWSPDLVVQDETGMMFLLYRSSVPFGRLFFALRNADSFIGERVRVQGWYRRGLKPYVEIAKIEANLTKSVSGSGPVSLFNNGGEIVTQHVVQRSYSRWIQMAIAAACSGLGIILLLSN